MGVGSIDRKDFACGKQFDGASRAGVPRQGLLCITLVRTQVLGGARFGRNGETKSETKQQTRL